MNGSAGVYEEDMMMIQPSPENMKCNTPEMERKSILTAVIFILSFKTLIRGIYSN
jgi:hypothetical protein